jgi:hypothetical protein
VEQHVHTERFGPHGRRRTDAAEADDAEAAAAQSLQRPNVHERPVAAAFAQSAGQQVDAARQRQRKPDGGVGDFLGAIVRHVGDGDPVPPGRRNIHVVEADAAADDQLTARQPADRLLGQAQRVINHQGIGVFDSAGEIALVTGVECHDIGDVAEDALFVDEGFDDEVGDDDLGATRHLSVPCHFLVRYDVHH